MWNSRQHITPSTTRNLAGFRAFLRTSHRPSGSKHAAKPKPTTSPPAPPPNPEPESNRIVLRMQDIPINQRSTWKIYYPRNTKKLERPERPKTMESDERRSRTFRLSEHTFKKAIQKKKLSSRMQGRIPYEFMTVVQWTAFDPVLSPNNVVISSRAPGLSTSYLVPAILKHIKNSPAANMAHTGRPTLDEMISWKCGPASTRLLIVAPTVGRARALEQKCKVLTPATVALNTSVASPSESERLNALRRDAPILVTTPFALLNHLVLTKNFSSAFVNLQCLVIDRAHIFPEMRWLPMIWKHIVEPRKKKVQIIITKRDDTGTMEAVEDVILSNLKYTLVAI